MWEVEVSRKSSGQENMEKDISMLLDLKSPKVRIYGWSNKCVSLGYSQNPDKEIDIDKAKEFDIEIVKRPTGGGIVFHNQDEVTYSVAAPAEYFPKEIKASYFFISGIVLKAIKSIGIEAQIKCNGLTPNPSPIGEGKGRCFKNYSDRSSLCFNFPQDYEITYKGKKLVGSAQKRNKKFILQQGTIAVSRPDNIFFEVLKNKREVKSHNDSLITVNEILNKPISFLEIANTLAEEFLRRNPLAPPKRGEGCPRASGDGVRA